MRGGYQQRDRDDDADVRPATTEVPAATEVTTLTYLQRTAGNRATTALVQRYGVTDDLYQPEGGGGLYNPGGGGLYNPGGGGEFYVHDPDEDDDEDEGLVEAPIPAADERRQLLGRRDPVGLLEIMQLARRLADAGELQEARRLARHAAVYARGAQKAAAEELFASLGGTFDEQGAGGAEGGSDLAEDQDAARGLAAELPEDHGRLEVGAQQGEDGWQLTGLGGHGHGMDPGLLAAGTLQYHEGDERDSQLAQLVDGAFVRMDGTPVSSTLTPENVGRRMGLAVNVRTTEIVAARLRAAGNVALADQISSLDNMDGRRMQLARDGLRELGTPLREVAEESREQIVAEGRMIYAMNRSGDFFIGEAEYTVTHHSSFLAGGAVACAGEVALSGGRVNAISNNSGHYQPGPAFLWQAVRQLQAAGMPLGGVTVEVVAAGNMPAAEFLAEFGMRENAPRRFTFDSAADVAMVRRHLQGLPEPDPHAFGQEEDGSEEYPEDDDTMGGLLYASTTYKEDGGGPQLYDGGLYGQQDGGDGAGAGRSYLQYAERQYTEQPSAGQLYIPEEEEEER